MKKNIVFVVHIDYPWKEGSAYRVDNIAKYLSKDYSVTVISPILESSFAAYSKIADYHVRRFNLRFLQKIRKNRTLFRLMFVALTVLGVANIRKKLSSKEISLVISEENLALLPALVLAYLSGAKLVIDDVLSQKKYYGEYVGFMGVLVNAIDIILIRRCAIIVASNQRIAKEIKASFRLTDSKVRVVPNGVTIPPFISHSKNGGSTTKDVVFVGSMYSEQNTRAVRNLIKIFPRVSKAVKNARLIIIDGPLDLLFQKLGISRSDLNSNVLIFGYLSDTEKEQYLMNASVCALPFDPKDTLIGGIRLKSLDFLSYGKVVVSTPTGIEGIEGAVSGQNLIIEENLDDFTERLIDVLNNPEKYKMISQNALKLAKNYQWINILSGYTSIAKKLTT